MAPDAESKPLKQSQISPKSRAARQARRLHLSILLPTKRFTCAATSRRSRKGRPQTPRRAVGLLSCVGVIVRLDSPAAACEAPTSKRCNSALPDLSGNHFC